MKIMAISGSLRAGSSNAWLLKGAARLVPAHVDVALDEGLGHLPHFNPDLDDEKSPDAVRAWRQKLRAHAGFIISAPEYAHGVPGALKDALDWLVSSGELVDKPVLLITASPSAAEFAHAQLTEILSTMSARVLPESIRTNLGRTAVDADGSISNPQLLAQLQRGVAALVAALG